MYIPSPLVPLVNTFREFRLITDTRNGVDRTSRSERDAMANAMQCNAMLACRDYNVDRRIEVVLSGGGRKERKGFGRIGRFVDDTSVSTISEMLYLKRGMINVLGARRDKYT